MPKNYSWFSDSKRARHRRRNLARETRRQRTMQLEQLEQRQLLAVGPNLVAIRPNTGGFLNEGDVLPEAPRELILQFSPGQDLNAATLAGGIQITRAGLDATFTPASIRSDFGTNGAVVLEFTASRLGDTGNGLQIALTGSDRGDQVAPGISVNGGLITIDLNTTRNSETTAQVLLDTIEGNSAEADLLTAAIVSGSATTVITPAVRDASEVANFSNEVQRLSAIGGPTVGDFQLTFNNGSMALQTDPIPFDATAAQVRSALELLVSIDPADILVTGGPLLLAPIDIEFTGQYSKTPLPEINVASNVTPGGVVTTESRAVVEIEFTSATPGEAGNGVIVNITRSDRGGSGPGVTVVSNVVNIDIDTNVASGAGGTTAGQLRDVVNTIAGAVVQAAILNGDDTTDVSQVVPTTPLVLDGVKDVSPLVLNGANAATAVSDLGTLGAIEVQYTAVASAAAGNGISVVTTKANRGASGGVGVTVSGNVITVQVNTHVANRTTARRYVNAINGNPAARALVIATLPIGVPETDISALGSALTIQATLGGANDVTITPGYINRGDNPNEVIVRFAETLPDDDYRLEIFGVSNAASATTSFRTTLDVDITNDVQVRFVSREPGVTGNNRSIQISKSSLGIAAPPNLSLSGTTIQIQLNTTLGSETSAQQLQDAIDNDAAISALLTTEITGNANANIATPAAPVTQLTLLGGFRLPLTNNLGEAFGMASDLARTFELNLAPHVVSVVPQPINRYTQNIELTGLPTGGSFKLIYSGQMTSPITVAAATSASAAIREAAVRTVLEGLASIGPGNVTVVSPAPLMWNVTFVGAVADRPIGILAGDATLLTGGTSPGVTVRRLQQAENRIDVYFNQDELDPASAENRAFYRVTDTQATLDPSDDVILLPESVSYDEENNVATLLFATAIPDGTHRLTIGTSDESNDTRDEAVNLGTLFDFSLVAEDLSHVAYTGDTDDGADDVDMYRLELNAGATLSVDVDPRGTHGTYVRVFRDSGSGVLVEEAMGVSSAAAIDASVTAPLATAKTTYYIGVSSALNTAYDPVAGGTTTNGATEGSYLLRVSVNRGVLSGASTLTLPVASISATSLTVDDRDQFPGSAPFTIEVNGEHLRVSLATGNTFTVERGFHNTTRLMHSAGDTVTWLSDDNSSFDTAISLGVLGTATKSLSSRIEAQGAFTTLPEYPGGLDEVGHRSIPPEVHIGPFPPDFNTTDYGGFEDGFDVANTDDAADLHDGLNLGRISDTNPSIAVLDYNFQNVYGKDLQGNPLSNTITANQRQRTREIFDLLSRYTGILFRETPSSGLTVVTGDLRVVNESTPVGPGEPFGKAGRTNTGLLAAVVDANETDHGSSEYGGKWFRTAFQMIGTALGLGRTYDLTAMMGDLAANTVPGGVGLSGEPVEPVFPGDQDIVHAQLLYRPDSTDIDLFKFDVQEPGTFSAETIAERRERSSLLNTTLRLYKVQTDVNGVVVTDANGNQVRELISQNDDYFGNDSFIGLDLEPGTYYIGVSSTGNENYDPAVSDTGGSGTSDGEYDLVLRFSPTPKSSLVDKAPAFEFLAGGETIVPGEFLEIEVDGVAKIFEFTNTGVVAFGNEPVLFEGTATPSDLARALADAINASTLNTVAEAAGPRVRMTGSPTLLSSGGIDFDNELLISESINPTLGHLEGIPFDGDTDGLPGGRFDFWFQAGETIFVDKSRSSTPGVLEGTGTAADPYDEIGQALLDAGFRINLPTDSQNLIQFGESFSIDDGTHPVVTFTFTNTTGVSGTGVGIASASSSDDIADLIVAAINGQQALGNLDALASKVVSGTRVRVNVVAANPAFATLNLGGTSALLTAPNLVRIVGNGNPTDFPGNARPYLVGLDDAGTPLEDGGTFDVPRGTTVMIDEGVLFKLQDAIIDVGSSTGTIDQRGAALQILGVPDSSVYFRSFHNDAIGGDSDAVGAPPGPGDWGGIVLRDDSDFEQEGIFLNWVNHAELNNGGGKVVVGSLEKVFTPIHLETARPTISFNRITNSADAAISANPNSFEDTLNRIGPDIYRNTLIGNSVNGLFVRIETQSGVPVEKLQVPARFDNDDIVHVITENLQIAGAPGGIAVSDEVQEIRIAGNPLAGDTFTLTFDGQTSRPIDFNANAAINGNEIQRVQIAGGPTSGSFTLGLQNEVQTIYLLGSPIQGTYRLRFEAPNGRIRTSTPIRFNASTNEVLQALEDMSTIDPGDVLVTGGPSPAALRVEFTGQYSGLNVHPMVVVDSTLTDGATALAPEVTDNEIQTLRLLGQPTGGTFQLRFTSPTGIVGTSSPIAFDAMASDIQTALESIAAINPGDVIVKGGPLPGTVTIEFAGSYARTNVQALTFISGAFPTLNASITSSNPYLTRSLSSSLPYNATAAQMRAGLEAMGAIVPGDVLVTGVQLPAALDIQFQGNFAGVDVNPLLVSVNTVANLVGPLTPTITDDQVPVKYSVQSRLQELISISVPERGEITIEHIPRDIIATGGPLPASPVQIEFVGKYAGVDVPLLTLASGTLTSGATITTSVIGESAITARPAARLAIDPGVILKFEGARIEAERGESQFIAEGSSERPIVFTSRGDDSYGASGTFDSSSDGATQGTPGDWGGLIFNAGASVSIDHALITFAGGRIPIEGDFDQFNAVEIHQADFRMTNSILENNASGLASSSRNGRGTNAEAVVFVRGAQPVVVDNIFRNNTVHDNLLTPNHIPVGTAMISINANALTSKIQGDYGRSTGDLNLVMDLSSNSPAFTNNRGPLIRRNLIDGNRNPVDVAGNVLGLSIKGLEVRGEELTIETVWDDTDIVHVLRDQIVVLNHHTFSGLRLQSNPGESLVVKLGGNPNLPLDANGNSLNADGSLTGFTASGTPLDIDDRIGGTVQVLGQPRFPVILTSLLDDSHGASFTINGLPHTDTNNDGNVTTPSAGDWRGIRLEQYSNDRNVVVVNEVEGPFTNGIDQNLSPTKAQFLGELAANEKGGDENRSLGFTVNGFIAVDDPSDIDVYSFKAPIGTEVWLDIDRTNASLDAVVELIAFNQSLFARSIDNNTLVSTPTVIARNMIRDDRLGPDAYSTNPDDPGMRLLLPGTIGTGIGTYYVRVRSNTAAGQINNVDAGLTRGEYQLQIRLRQQDEKGGSNIRFANIQYPQTGIHAIGLPAHSPLVGEAAEVEAPNDDRGSAQNIGNLLRSDRNTISVAGRLDAADDVDWYRVELTYQEIQAIAGVNDATRAFSTIFDLDYADQLSRADAVLSIYDENGTLILVARDSNIVDDQPGVGEGNDFDDLSRGTLGKLDPYVGPVTLFAETPGQSEFYYVAVSSNLRLPSSLDQTFNAASATPLVRLEPINSINRVVEDHIGFFGTDTGYVSGDDLDGTQPDGFRFIAPDNAAIFDTDDNGFTTEIHLDTQVIPWTLEDVQLFVSSGNSAVSINPFNGQSWYTIGGGSNVVDLDMRTDGRLFFYSVDTTANNDSSGRVDEIDVGGGDLTNYPDETSELGVPTAFAFRRTGGGDIYDGYFIQTIGGQSGLAIDAEVPADPNHTHVPIPITGIGGIVNGISFGYNQNGGGNQFTELYGVTDAGEFISLGTGGFNATVLTTFPGIRFTGLTLGPQSVEPYAFTRPNEDGRYSRILFATATNGRMYAIDPRDPNGDGSYLPSLRDFDLDGNGVPDIFDTNQDGQADDFSVRLSAGGVSGLAFSRVDYNLWHPTTRRGGDPGHGVNGAFDIYDESRNGSSGSTSFYFGLDESGGPPLNYPNQTGQLGVLDTFEFDLRGNGAIGNNYNVAGGSHGTLESAAFSLQGYSRTDKPTLYVNYFLDTETTNSNGVMRDSARIFVTRDDGASWEMLATNNSVLSTFTNPANPNVELPTYITTSRDTYPAAPNQRVQELFDIDEPGAADVWRQARVDLADFAGEPNLRFRFDFSAAGVITENNSMPGDVDGAGFRSGLRALNNDQEGFFIDDIIVGFAERGEAVTGPLDQRGGSAFFNLPSNPVFGAPPQSLIGEYQLEIRRGTEFVGNDVIKLDFNDPHDPVWIGETLSPIEQTVAAGGSNFEGRNTKILTTWDTNERF
ncbi:MAG: hypothetical protein O3C40_02205, partial [Planctomycetota bacterium]|nr:hypothetical protein [Planctomycetota bacterium]